MKQTRKLKQTKKLKQTNERFNRREILKKLAVVGGLSVSALAAGYFTGVAETTRSNFQPMSYQVYADSDNKWKANQNTTTNQISISSNTDAAAVINSALASLTPRRTWKEKVAVRGAATITTTIRVPSYTILDLTEASLTLANGANTHMIQNAGGYTKGDAMIDINGGLLDGNGANQNTGDVIHLRTAPPYDIRFSGLRVQNGYRANVYVPGIQRLCMNNCELIGRPESLANLWFNTGSDSMVENCGITGNSRYALLLQGQSGSLFSNCYLGGGSTMVYIGTGAGNRISRGLHFSNCFVDSQAAHGYDIESATEITIIGGRIVPWSGFIDNSADGIYVSDSTHVLAMGLCIDGYDSRHRLKYAIEEAGSSDYNRYLVSPGPNIAADNYNIVGAHSTVL